MPQTQVFRLSNGEMLDLSPFDISTPEGRAAAKQAIAQAEVKLQLPQTPTKPAGLGGQPAFTPGDRALLAKFNPPANPDLDALKATLTDPKNRGDVGGLLGGLGGLAIGGPIGSAAGAALGGTLGSYLGQQELTPNASPRELAPKALGEGAWQLGADLFGLAIPSKLTERLGKHVLRGSFGPQSAAVREFGADPDKLFDQLLETKLKTPITAPVGSRRLINIAQKQHIDPALAARTQILEGPAGDITRPSNSVFRPVKTVDGDTLNPFQDAVAEMKKPTANRAGVEAVAKHVREFYDDPRMLGAESHVVPRPNPDLEDFLSNLQGQGFSPELQQKLAAQSGIPTTIDKTITTKSLIKDLPARDRQEMVTANYKILDDQGAFGDPSMSALARVGDREARKAITRNLKEGVVADIPEIAPLNKEMSEWIPFREAAVQSRYQGTQVNPQVRFGEAFALSTLTPRTLLGSVFNRPTYASVLGQGLTQAGRGLQRGRNVPPALSRLSFALANPDAPSE